MRVLRARLTFANVMSVVAVFIALGGFGYAASISKLPKNSVGTAQLKNGAVTGLKVAKNTLTGANVNASTLGTVPTATHAATADSATNATHATSADNATHAVTADSATHATSADNASNAITVDGHEAGCPENTVLIRGVCFDSSPSEAPNVQSASEGCAAQGGWLPTPLELYSTRDILNLGNGSGTEHQYTDEVYANGSEYQTVVVDGIGSITEVPITASSHYYCAYTLVF